MRHSWIVAVCWCAISGCGGGAEVDGGPTGDGGSLPDAGGLDAGSSPDAGSDGGALDGGGSDAGMVDAGGMDAGPAGMDAGVDAGDYDAGPASAPVAGDLVVVEIQGNPQTATDEEAEYIELLNVSGRALDLAGVQLAHLDWTGGEPDRSVGFHTIADSVIVLPGARVLLTRSNGGFFGGATRDYVYDGFVFSNGGTRDNRLRVMVPSWDGTEPPAPADIIDEVRTGIAAFDNPVRGRALELDPSLFPSPTAASNDDPASLCQAAANAGLEYFTGNWGTPRIANRCN